MTMSVRQAAWRSGMILLLVTALARMTPAQEQSRAPLVVRVSPTLAQPPAFIVIRADVEVHDDNRSLEVSAEGDYFYTSSSVPLEGNKAPRFTEIHFDNLPTGSYTVKTVLMGSRGERATVKRTVVVGESVDALP